MTTTLKKTVKIPVNRRVSFNLPKTFIPGQLVTFALSPVDITEPSPKYRETMQKLRRLCANSSLTADKFLELRRADKELEKAIDKGQHRGQI